MAYEMGLDTVTRCLSWHALACQMIPPAEIGTQRAEDRIFGAKSINIIKYLRENV